jgi:hypothetical protein
MGVILWAHGRSATDTLANAFGHIAKMPYCNHVKEGFKNLAKRGLFLSTLSLRRCIEKKQLFTHVKPMHLVANQSALKTPAAFFMGAWDAGFRTVISSFRTNQLATAVSSYELKNKKQSHRTFDGAEQNKLINKFKAQWHSYRNGVVAATALGYVVVELNFTQVTTQLCESVNLVLDAMLAHHAATGYRDKTAPTRCTTASISAANHNKHMHSSHHNALLWQRIGKINAKLVTDQLQGSDYEWMLNLSALGP